MSDEVRTPRASDERDNQKRIPTWKPQSGLPQPNPRDGLEYRYVRVGIRGEVDNVNFSKAMRDYWTPVKASDYSEITVMTDRRSEFPEGIVIGGLVLCCRDKAIGDQIREYGDEEMRQQMRSVEKNYYREEKGGGRRFSEQTTRVNSFSDG